MFLDEGESFLKKYDACK